MDGRTEEGESERTSLMRLSRRNGRVDLNRGGKHVEWMMMAHTLLSAWKIHYFLLYQMRSIKSITLSIRVWCGPCSSPGMIECSIIAAAGFCTFLPTKGKSSSKQTLPCFDTSAFGPRMQSKDEVGRFRVCRASCGFRPPKPMR